MCDKGKTCKNTIITENEFHLQYINGEGYVKFLTGDDTKIAAFYTLMHCSCFATLVLVCKL
jgi:hypothetical protein